MNLETVIWVAKSDEPAGRGVLHQLAWTGLKTLSARAPAAAARLSAIGPPRPQSANHIVEMALAHVVGDKVEAAYRRGELLGKRKELADAWSKYCTSSPAGQTVCEEVLTLRGDGR